MAPQSVFEKLCGVRRSMVAVAAMRMKVSATSVR
jgi:hypothetical protein